MYFVCTVQRPRRVGAKFTGDDIKPDEHLQPQLSFDFDGKRDRYALILIMMKIARMIIFINFRQTPQILFFLSQELPLLPILYYFISVMS